MLSERFAREHSKFYLILGFVLALKFFAVGFGLLGASASSLTRGRRTPTPRNSLPTFAEKLLMRFESKP